MAKEHIYARTGYGFFSKASGYDTAALSSGLSEKFVKNCIHRYCTYRIHAFTDEEKTVMPDSYFLVRPDGSILFGKNSYCYGERNSTMSISYLVCGLEEMDKANKNISSVIGFGGYRDIVPESTDNGILPEVPIENIINCESVLERFYSVPFLFHYLNIDDKNFSLLLSYVIQSVLSDNTVYIKLNCPRSVISEIARELLRNIFEALPVIIRNKLSYITYTPVLELNNFYNIIFVDKELSLDSVNKKSFIMDFTTGGGFSYEYDFLKFSYNNILNFNSNLLNCEFYVKTDGYEKFPEDFINSFDSQKDFFKKSFDFFRKNKNFTESLRNNRKLYFTILGRFIELSGLLPEDEEYWERHIFGRAKKAGSSNNDFYWLNYLLTKGLNSTAKYSLYTDLFLLDKEASFTFILNKLSKCNTYKALMTVYYFYLFYFDKIFTEKKKEELTYHIIELTNKFNEKIYSFKELSDLGFVKNLIVLLNGRAR